MFGAKQHVRQHLDLIRPFMNRWSAADFASPEVQEVRTRPTHTLFLIPLRPLPSFLEARCLGPRITGRLNRLLGGVDRYNLLATRFNYSPAADKLDFCVMAHCFLNTLFDEFVELEAAL